MKLSSLDQARAKFHLGYGTGHGIDFGDLAQLEEAFNTITNDYIYNRIVEQLNICDAAFNASQLIETGGRYTTKEIYLGDINRSILRDTAKDVRIWNEYYNSQCDELAHLLWVPNYRDEGTLRYRHERAAGAFMKAVPGIADTSVASRRQEVIQLAGSFGY